MLRPELSAKRQIANYRIYEPIGNSAVEYYDGSVFASYEDVVVVTINYRTNGKYSTFSAEGAALTT